MVVPSLLLKNIWLTCISSSQLWPQLFECPGSIVVELLTYSPEIKIVSPAVGLKCPQVLEKCHFPPWKLTKCLLTKWFSDKNGVTYGGSKPFAQKHLTDMHFFSRAMTTIHKSTVVEHLAYSPKIKVLSPAIVHTKGKKWSWWCHFPPGKLTKCLSVICFSAKRRGARHSGGKEWG